MNNLSGVITGAVIVIAVIAGVLWYQNRQSPSTQNTQGAQGTLYIGVTDATADIKDVNEINLEVKKVEVHSATKGWVTVSSDSKTYGLLKLNADNKTELYAQATVATGIYDQVRVSVGDAIVKTKTKGDVKAYLPSDQITMKLGVIVAKDKKSHVKVDVLADQSIHATVDGKYVFTPVVQAESRSNVDVSVSFSNAVTLTGGSVDATASVGIDLNGASKVNFKLDTTAGIKVETLRDGSINFILGGKMYSNDVPTKATATSSSETTGTVNSSTGLQGVVRVKGDATSTTDANAGVKLNY